MKKKTLNKTAPLVLLVLIVILVASILLANASAYECDHANKTLIDENVVKYQEYDNNLHHVYTYDIYYCGNCHENIWEQVAHSYEDHHFVKFSATCNGQRQTIVYHCINCGGGTMTELVTCPGAPHEPGQCRWLPV